eukprot:Plantae.Rhodophyta-Hildenbrandia_rubra.ctg49697.p1 GENE.Plantae.Rhodophyta-Hildenbrandia_rubra.ctg49697~~Plantae.Rhodophyta-Hildenbrandia_rubra.ctg49697.p1  ORF type:complete len:515 (+),score=93.30 Plantae.Rhodophyta-Hildenbrandia_rubra.ctg49697:389-1933(+)
MSATTASSRESEIAIGFHTSHALGAPEISLPVRGKIPSWINGVLYRTGPGVYEVGETKIQHWFDGLGCVYRFEIEDGKVKYRSELVNEGMKAMGSRGDGVWFGQDICKGVFGKVMGMWKTGTGGLDQSNIGVTVGGFPGKELVVRTDSDVCLEIDGKDLKEKERFTYEMLNSGKKGELIGDMAAAHAQYDVGKGELWNFTLKLGPPPGGVYKMFKVTKNGAKFVTSLTRKPSYIHSFAMTKNYVILILWPCHIAPLKTLYEKNLLSAMNWNGNENTRFYVIERDSCRHVATYESDPFFSFHTVNAYEKSCGKAPHRADIKADIIIDLCRYDDMKIIQSFKTELLRTKEASYFPEPYLTRYTLADIGFAKTRGPTILTRATETRLCSSQNVELPRFNSALHMCPYKYVYGTSNNTGKSQFIFNSLIKINVETGDSLSWFEPHCYTGEPIFLADPEAEAGEEDKGVLLSVVLDATAKASFLLILNAKDMTEIARASVPQVVPLGFHGNFLGSARSQ